MDLIGLLESRIEKLKELLRGIEYVQVTRDPDIVCLFCWCREGDGHMKDCELVINNVVHVEGGAKE